MRICDICKKEEARPENARFGEDYCDTCANKIYQHSQELKEQYRQEQIEKPVLTSEIKLMRPLGPQPEQKTVELTENLGVSDVTKS